MPDINPLSEPKDIIVQHFLVAFLDVLGQRAELRSLVSLPTNEEDLRRTATTLKRTLGFVLKVRALFKEFFTKFSEPSEFLKLLPEPERVLLRELRKSEVSFYGFSDSFVVAIPLRTDNDHCTQMNGVYAALIAACWTPVASLFDEHTLRGGIDVGVGVQLGSGEVYGAALERAYTLESEVAGHPRIAVGNELIQYLEFVRDLPVTTIPGRCAKEVARRCLRFIMKDIDGQPILDFLGEAFREASDRAVKPDLVRKSYQFVIKEYDHWMTSGNDKLALKYKNLREYFETRKSLWGLQ